MINLDITELGVKELIATGSVDVVVQGCNCFHVMNGPVAESLKDLTKDDILTVDINFSQYGDINKLASWTNCEYEFDDHMVDVYNLYVQYTMPAAGCDTIHWASVHDGLIDLLSSQESGKVVGLEHLGQNAQDRSEFLSLLNSIIKQNEDELPDVDIMVFDK